VQRAVQMPGEALAWVGAYFASKRELEDENANLKRQLLAQTQAAQEANRLRDENASLRSLLDMGKRYGSGAIAADVLYTGRDPFTQKLFVNRGSDAGIQAGNAVIDELGVVGQVTRVFPGMAEVTLITDKDQAVPVRVERNGVRSVVFGAGAGRAPELRFMAPNADLKQGDRLLTSGIDGTYPAGLAVAVIDQIQRETGNMFAKIVVRPLSGADRSVHLLVLAQSVVNPPRPEEPNDGDVVKKGRGKGRRGS
jgi:rod shape-determining protein MreC